MSRNGIIIRNRKIELLEDATPAPFCLFAHRPFLNRWINRLFVNCFISFPASIFWLDEELGSDIYLDGIVTVTDAKYGLEQLNDPNLVEDKENTEEEESSDLPTNTAKKQIALADLILLNKLDMVSEEQKVNVKRALEAVNASAPIIETKFSQIPLDKILDMNAYGNEMPEKIPTESNQHIDKSIGTGIDADIYIFKSSIDIKSGLKI